jgi:hypothetical protein
VSGSAVTQNLRLLAKTPWRAFIVFPWHAIGPRVRYALSLSVDDGLDARKRFFLSANITSRYISRSFP